MSTFNPNISQTNPKFKNLRGIHQEPSTAVLQAKSFFPTMHNGVPLWKTENPSNAFIEENQKDFELEMDSSEIDKGNNINSQSFEILMNTNSRAVHKYKIFIRQTGQYPFWISAIHRHLLECPVIQKIIDSFQGEKKFILQFFLGLNFQISNNFLSPFVQTNYETLVFYNINPFTMPILYRMELTKLWKDIENGVVPIESALKSASAASRIPIPFIQTETIQNWLLFLIPYFKENREEQYFTEVPKIEPT